MERSMGEVEKGGGKEKGSVWKGLRHPDPGEKPALPG